MHASPDFQPMYPRHDLLIEIGKVEMAIDGLATRDEQDRGPLRSRLESHMARLRSALAQLAA